MKFVVLALAGLVAAYAAPADLKGQALVDYVNANAKTWTAKLHTRDYSKTLMRKEFVKVPEGVEEVEHLDMEVGAIPATFDARTQWPKCPTIGTVRDQSDCGSCWAFAAAESMSDRTCIAKGTNIYLSSQDVLSCCGSSCGDGCEGGYPIQAWKFWVQHGVVTGSSYLENAGCQPYSIPPCGHHNGTYYKECPQDIYPTPACSSSCRSGYSTPYAQDKHFGKSAYKVSKTVSSIQQEILTNGPVEAAFIVYSDFYDYTSGVYHHTNGFEEGGHAVKILGWGTDAGTPYWLVANSWDTDWGESGFFRIRRGHNECGIEEAIVAGLPK